MPRVRTAERRSALAPYKARGAAASVWRDRSPELMMSGPMGTGKTRGCLEKVHACLLRWPGARAAIVRKSRNSLNQTALVTFEEKVLPPGSALARGPKRSSRESYLYENGSELVVAGLNDPSKLYSAEYDIIYVVQAEELEEDEWEKVGTRLRNGVMPFQQLLGDCNPEGPSHWIKQRIDAGLLPVHESRHEDNPELYDLVAKCWTPKGVAYIARLDKLTGPRRERYRFGRWAAAEGLVFDKWDSAVHLIEPFPIPPEWRRIRSIDFGFVNPLVVQWWAIDGDGRMYLYRELYETKQLIADVAKKIIEIERWYKTDETGATVANEDREQIDDSVADHDAEARAVLDSCGIPTRPAFKNVLPGIDCVQQRLRLQEDGRPRMFLFRGALLQPDPELVEARKPICTAGEIESYVWTPATQGRNAKEEPVKRDDHGCDALRYAACYADDMGIVRIEAI